MTGRQKRYDASEPKVRQMAWLFEYRYERVVNPISGIGALRDRWP